MLNDIQAGIQNLILAWNSKPDLADTVSRPCNGVNGSPKLALYLKTGDNYYLPDADVAPSAGNALAIASITSRTILHCGQASQDTVQSLPAPDNPALHPLLPFGAYRLGRPHSN